MSYDSMMKAANRLAKWRTIFAGWQLGTRPKSDPEAQAVRDATERSLLLRAEVSGITRVLLDKGIVTHAEMEDVFEEEYDALSEMLEGQFPGAKAADHGMDIDVQKFAETTKDWLP